jgi:uncharacterized protein
MPQVRAEGHDLKIVELSREDLPSVSACWRICARAPHQFLLFCDDLSFSHDDQHYKSLKAVLDGGIEGRPENVLFYATSNRRHLMPRDMIENERSTAINPARRWRRRCRCPTVSACGWGSTPVRRTTIWR